MLGLLGPYDFRVVSSFGLLYKIAWSARLCWSSMISNGNARLLESLLALDGHAVRTADNGAEALRLVRAEPPDLVLMDVMMPHVRIGDR